MILDHDHKEMVKCLAKNGMHILLDLTPSKVDLWHGATGCCTEAGELLDAVKKVVCYSKPIDRENVIEELGDLEFYMEMVRATLGITREDTLKHNMAKLAERYKNYKYSDQQAIDRADKRVI
jgi:NTP pyrophosphatase (non-canonical NTP hydrolase)